MTQPPAGWFPDPEDATQLRYWDGAAWTEHRSPRPPTTTDQLAQAGGQLADGLAKGFTAFGKWVNETTATKRPTFASVAASCRDEAPRHPLSVTVELVGDAVDAAGTTALLAGAPSLDVLGRLVPNPWDPATPNAVAVLVGTTKVGRLPVALEAAYCGPLAQLTTQRLLATCSVLLGPAGVTVRLPEVSALAGASPPA